MPKSPNETVGAGTRAAAPPRTTARERLAEPANSARSKSAGESLQGRRIATPTMAISSLIFSSHPLARSPRSRRPSTTRVIADVSAPNAANDTYTKLRKRTSPIDQPQEMGTRLGCQPNVACAAVHLCRSALALWLTLHIERRKTDRGRSCDQFRYKPLAAFSFKTMPESPSLSARPFRQSLCRG